MAKRKRSLKGQAAMQPAKYPCGHPGCRERLLLGIRNEFHVRYAHANMRMLGWDYDETQGKFFCDEHNTKRQTPVDGTSVTRDSQNSHSLHLRVDPSDLDVNLPVPEHYGMDETSDDDDDADDELRDAA